MSYVRLSDDFADNPKVRKLDKTALAVHVWALCHCARHLTDGYVALEAVAGCPWVSKRSALDRALGNLQSAGLWKRAAGGWRIHDYLEFNPDRATVREKRRLAAERQARWRENKQRRHNASRNASTSERVTHSPTPTPKGVGVQSDGGALNGAPPLCVRCELNEPVVGAKLCLACIRAEPKRTVTQA